MRFNFAAAIAVVVGSWASGVDAAPAAAPLPSWTGCYVGGNAGAGFLDASVYEYYRFPGSGGIVGGQIGCDVQIAPKWVVGIAGSWDFNGARGVFDEYAPPTYQFNVPWVATATGRVGYSPSPDVLLYAKGGIAWNNANAEIVYDGVVVEKFPYSQTGWTAGIGAEWRKNAHWSLFAEYDYTEFKGSNYYVPIDNQLSAFLFGLNLRFGGK